MKKLLVIALALTMIFALSITAAANPSSNGAVSANITNQNQDFSATIVTAEASALEVFVDEEAEVALFIENVLNRGLSDATIWVNGACVWKNDIGSLKSAAYTFDVDTSEAGAQVFEIEVWSRLGNKNFQQLLFKDVVTIEILEKIKTPEAWVEDITNAINEAILAVGAANIEGLVVSYGNNNTAIILVIDGVEYVFVGGGGIRSDKTAVIDGVRYTIVISNNPTTFRITIR